MGADIDDKEREESKLSERHEQQVTAIVESFKASLDRSARAHISEHQFEELALMIRAFVADELNEVANLLENTARRLRISTEQPQREL